MRNLARKTRRRPKNLRQRRAKRATARRSKSKNWRLGNSFEAATERSPKRSLEAADVGKYVTTRSPPDPRRPPPKGGLPGANTQRPMGPFAMRNGARPPLAITSARPAAPPQNLARNLRRQLEIDPRNIIALAGIAPIAHREPRRGAPPVCAENPISCQQAAGGHTTGKRRTSGDLPCIPPGKPPPTKRAEI